jgi:integrase
MVGRLCRSGDATVTRGTTQKSTGVPAKVVQEILGHSHINITLGIYAHVLPGMHKEAMNRMDDWFGNDDEKTNPTEKGE